MSPALLIRISMSPTSAASCSIAAVLDRSSTWFVTFTPWPASRVCLAVSMASPLRAARCRWHPSAANTSATASPIPFDAPVIRAVLFVSLSSTPNLQDAIQICKSKQFAYQEIGRLLEGGEKVEEVVAKQIDVVAHGAVGPLRIMGQNRRP